MEINQSGQLKTIISLCVIDNLDILHYMHFAHQQRARQRFVSPVFGKALVAAVVDDRGLFLPTLSKLDIASQLQPEGVRIEEAQMLC